MLIQICGSAAEACHTGRDLESVWDSYASESDFKGAVQDGVWAGLDTSDITKFINEGMEHAVALVCQPNAQNAIYALANALPSSGRLAGRRVAFITEGPLAETAG